MRRFGRLALLVAFFVLVSSASAFAASNAVIKLPVSSYHKGMVRVDGDVIVWEDGRTKTNWWDIDGDIYAYDMSTGEESAIATGPSDQRWPAISGNTIVWGETVIGPRGWAIDQDIWSYDLVTKTRSAICTAAGIQGSPEISGDIVVWEDYRNAPPNPQVPNSAIYGYDLATHTEFLVCAGPAYQPDVWGDWVVWTDVSNPTNFNIKAKNIRTGEQRTVCADAGRQDYPRIDNGLIVWQDYTTGAGDIRGYDLTTRSRVNVAVTSASEHGPEISGNIVGWCKMGSNNFNTLVGYDRLSGSSFTIQPSVATNSFSGLSGGRVVWPGLVSDWTTDIYLTQVTQDEGIAGAGRYATAVQASKAAFPDGADTVVIATGQNWPDALGGSALAGVLDAPLLITPKDTLEQQVSDEITRLHAKTAIVLGSEAAVGSGPYDSLVRLLGEGNVTRIQGGNRYETASAVASETIAEQGTAYDGTAFVATGAGFADAMSASPLAALEGWPVFLAGPSGVSADTLATMKDHGVTKVVILGSYKVISDAEMARLQGEFGKDNVTRLGGGTRYGTAAAIGDYAVGRGLLHWDDLAISTGENYPDGLTGGVLQAKREAPMLLTNKLVLSDPTATELRTHDPAIDTFTYLGSTAAVSAPVRKAIRDILR